MNVRRNYLAPVLWGILFVLSFTAESTSIYPKPLENKAEDLLLAAESGDVTVLEAIVKELSSATGRNSQSFSWDAQPRINPNGDTPLHRAARRDQVDAVKLLLPQFFEEILRPNAAYMTPIEVAVDSDAVKTLAYLLSELPALVETRQLKSKNRPTLLHLAAKNGKLDILKILLKNGANILAVDSGKMMAIHFGALNGHQSIVEHLLANADAHLQISATNENGTQPIHLAAKGGHASLVRLLVVKRGVAVDVREDRTGRTALHVASAWGHLDVVKALVLELRADLYARSSRDDDEILPIHLAAYFGNLEVVTFFLERDSTLATAYPTRSGYLPIHSAANGGSQQVISYFLTQLRMDVNLKSSVYGTTPLHMAAANGHLELVKFLLNEKGAKAFANAFDVAFKALPVHLAAFYGHIGVVDFMTTKWPILLKAVDGNGVAIIHYAASNERIDLVRFLVKNNRVGVDQASRTRRETPLHLAAALGHLELVKVLLTELNANLMARRFNSDMAIHIACSSGMLPVVKYLLELQPSLVYEKGANGMTPLQLAEAAKTEESAAVADWLRSILVNRVNNW